MVREAVVLKLIEWAQYAVEVGADRTSASADEILSTYLTLTRVTMRVMREKGADVHALRAGVELLMLECVDPNVRPA